MRSILKTFGVGFVLIQVVNLALLVGFLYVVAHFVAKFW